MVDLGDGKKSTAISVRGEVLRKASVEEFYRAETWDVSCLERGFQEFSDDKVLLTGFYGFPDTTHRRDSWKLLRLLKPSVEMAWLCYGDFNELMHHHAKQGGARRPYKQMEEFRSNVDYFGLSDLGFEGNKYTWCNKREGPHFTKERLDRALVLQRGSHILKSQKYLGHCKEALMKWSRTTLRQYRKETQIKLQHLANLQESNTGSSVEIIKEVKLEIDKFLEEDNVKWKQRAKQACLEEGDRNSKVLSQMC
ncbi:uncharacterized protein LOC118348144 [Juglans regia]|uniref:Uncharacterized protein LOC118348144 n=1 Tax=Juglans regia TaxID=51240 RepID=A0A6P9EC88_JUGRE|nr:uncharacterized protein LOC118348144 [Juglans regia]